MAHPERKRRPARGGADLRWQADQQPTYGAGPALARRSDDLASANLQWNGGWSIDPPADHVRGLYRMHQITARELLFQGVGRLTEAEARFLQVVAFQWRPLSNLQRHWLSRLDRQHGRIAA